MQASPFHTDQFSASSRPLGLLLLFIFALQGAAARVSLSPLFSDGMVLQQKSKVALWGKSTTGKEVMVTTSWNGKRFRAPVGGDGSWKLTVPTPKGGGPYTISFEDGETVTLKDVLIGEVWVCSGQSNMEMPVGGWGKVKNYKEELAAADFPNIRLIRVERSTSTQPLAEAKWSTSWQPCSEKTVAEFSAVAYFFARDIQKHHNVPIGLIQTAYSGTPAESWVSGPSLHTMPAYDSLVTLISSKAEAPKNAHIPTVLFNAMVNPLIPYGIRGVIWYQGESNAGKAYQYQTLFPLLIKDWRNRWGKKEMPFYFVQLANFKEVEEQPAASDWAELREAQLKTLSLPHTGMAVAIDLGEVKDIHPKNKQDVGARLALIARNQIYKEKVPFSGPLFRSYSIRGNRMEIAFDHTNGGLKTPGGAPLQGFAIAGEDKKFYWATAEIRGNKVVVWSEKVAAPVAVRYAWAINPLCNLYNGAHLPASPFRTDNWKGLTEPK